jgi:hypothetical protein
MRHIIVQNLKTLRRGPTKGREDDVVFLHMLLNYHLGPPDDQLPLTGRDATAFGPRTEAKVKKFQEVNKIDTRTASSLRMASLARIHGRCSPNRS